MVETITNVYRLKHYPLTLCPVQTAFEVTLVLKLSVTPNAALEHSCANTSESCQQKYCSVTAQNDVSFRNNGTVFIFFNVLNWLDGLSGNFKSF